MSEHDRTDLDLLRDLPVGELAPASQVKARGAQRHRRRLSAVGGAGAAVLLLAGTGLALTSGPQQDALRTADAPAVNVTADQPSPLPSASPEPSPSPSASPEPPPSAAASPSAPSTTTPQAAPTAAPPSGAPEAAAALPATALVSAQELGVLSDDGAAWSRISSSRRPVEWPLDPCGTGTPAAEGAVAHLSAVAVPGPGPGPFGLVEGDIAFSQQVVRYASPVDAARAAAALLEQVSACPVAQQVLYDRTSIETRLVPVAGTPGLVEVREVWLYNGEADASEFGVSGLPESPRTFITWGGVVVEGDLVATWLLPEHHGMPEQAGLAVSELVRTALCRTAGTC